MITAAGWLGVFIAVANTGHLFCPLLILGLHDGLRSAAIVRWQWHAGVAAATLLLAFATPLWAALGAYAAWNLYHYAMQHNGFWQLTRWRARTADQRLTMRTSWLAITAVGVFEASFAPAMSIFHWLGDIGLSTVKTPRRLLFVILLAALASTGLVLMNHGLREAFPLLVRLRLWLGFLHFAASAFVWPAALRVPVVNGERKSRDFTVYSRAFT